MGLSKGEETRLDLEAKLKTAESLLEQVIAREMPAVEAACAEIRPRTEGKRAMLFVGGSRAHHYQELFGEMGMKTLSAGYEFGHRDDYEGRKVLPDIKVDADSRNIEELAIEAVARMNHPAIAHATVDHAPNPVVVNQEDPPAGRDHRAGARHVVVLPRVARAAHPLQVSQRCDLLVVGHRIVGGVVQVVRPFVDIFRPLFSEGFRFQISDFKLQVSGLSFQVSDFRFHPSSLKRCSTKKSLSLRLP